MRTVLWVVSAAVAAMSGLADAARAEAPRVVASIAPIHSLVANVMDGVGEPRLLIQGYASPHAYQLRPSDAADLARADVIVWIGPGLETVLSRSILALADQARIVSLAEIENLIVWPVRTGNAWTTDDPHEHAEHDAVDQHLWLSPDNAVAMVKAIADALVAKDAENAAVYRANATRAIDRIKTLALITEQRLAQVQDVPYVVMHDAYQYFERRFGLNAVGAISISPDRPPSARRLRDLREQIHRLGAACAFAEPQIAPALMDTLIEDTAIKRDILDPVGASILPGPDAYFTMMTANADALARCLSNAD